MCPHDERVREPAEVGVELREVDGPVHPRGGRPRIQVDPHHARGEARGQLWSGGACVVMVVVEEEDGGGVSVIARIAYMSNIKYNQKVFTQRTWAAGGARG